MAEHVKQIENKRSFEYQHNQRRDQIIPNPLLSNRHTDDQRPEKYTPKERFKNPNSKFTGFFQGQANLNTGRVAGYYYNACTKVAFKDPPTNQNLENESNLLNQRIQNYDQMPSTTTWYPTYRDNLNASTPRMTKPQSEKNIRNFNQPQVSPLTPQLPKSICQKTHITYKRTWKLDQWKIWLIQMETISVNHCWLY